MELMVETRDKFGGASSKRLRRDNKIPAIIYGQGKPTEHITIGEKDFLNFLRGHERVVKMKLPKSSQVEEFLIKEVQYDFLGELVEHIDFIRFDASAKTTITIPLEFVGNPEGTKQGGILETMIKELHLEISPKDAPEFIRIRVMQMKLNDVLKIKDIEIPKGSSLVGHRLEDIVAQVKQPAPEKEVTEITGVTMPEVIKRKEEKEEGEENEKE
ncbi:MAG: 50S ribosomal protein L25 [Planctomycetota bacterium]